MSDLRESIITLLCHQYGIVPLTYDDKDVNRILAALPRDEQVRMKRKFRKMWRKGVLRAEFPARAGEAYKESMLLQRRRKTGLGADAPTREQKKVRKAIVLRRIFGEMNNFFKEKV